MTNKINISLAPFLCDMGYILEPDQTPHCLLSALSEIVNYFPTTLESEMDPAFWQYCEILLGIYGFSLNNNNNTTTTNNNNNNNNNNKQQQ